jgi:hypothetical protein
VPELQNSLLISASLACVVGWVLVHLQVIGQVDPGRTITSQVSKPEVALLSIPFTFYLGRLRAPAKT